VITAVAVLRLAADGRLDLDDPANRYLRAVRLADDAVTVRELLLHTGGVDNDISGLYAPRVPDLATAAAGPVLACTGGRGDFGFSHAGYAALGQLIAEITGVAYPDATTRLVLGPLGMNESWFPASWPGTDAVTSYEAASETFRPGPGMVCAIPAAGGLWTTAGDLVRFGLGWSSLLPRELAREALRPQAPRPNGTHSGLGWIVNEPQNLAGHAGDGPSASASLLIRLSGGEAHAALTSRQMPIEAVNARVLRTLTSEAETRPPSRLVQ
jgi:CubicO group peptidase (beta-lactamase class C family)